jgi:hypothetical protein
MAQLTVEEARQAARSATSEGQVRILSEAAVRSKRLDLIAVYLEEKSTWFKTVSAAKALPASSFKDRVVIVMMRAPVPYWPREDEMPYRRDVLICPTTKEEPFRSVIERLMPAGSVPDFALFNKDSRLKLATELESAMAKEASNGKEANEKK